MSTPPVPPRDKQENSSERQSHRLRVVTIMSKVTFTQSLPQPLDAIWQLHQTPGIVARLTPGASFMSVAQQADNLRDGQTRFDLPGGVQWIANHVPGAFHDSAHSKQFQDVCATPGLGAVSGWTHTHRFVSSPAGTDIHDSIETTLPKPLARRVLAPVFRYRQNQLEQDLAFIERSRKWRPTVTATSNETDRLTIAITGARGLVGTQLSALLQLAGHRVITLRRGKNSDAPAHSDERIWATDNPATDLLRGMDCVIHLAGSPIAGRFTSEHLAKVRGSRVEPTRKLAEVAAKTEGLAAFVSASAVGYYGYDQASPATETHPAGSGHLAEIVRDWEEATRPAAEAGVRVVNVRSGLVLAGGAAMLEMLRLSVRLGGGRLGSGEQHFAWVALDDVVDVYARAALDASLEGPVNAVGPQRVTNAEFTKTLAEVAGGAPLIPVPAIAPAVVFGQDGARELALADQNVIPAALQEAEHVFRYPTLAAALRHELLKE